MPNLPGYDFIDHAFKTWTGALANQATIWNKAWGDMEAGTFELKHLIALYAKSYRMHYEACRQVATFDVKSVEWQLKTLRAGDRDNVEFKVPSTVNFADVTMSRVDAIGASPPNMVNAAKGALNAGIMTVNLAVDGRAVDGQYIAFAYDSKNGGPPLGIALIVTTP